MSASEIFRIYRIWAAQIIISFFVEGPNRLFPPMENLSSGDSLKTKIDFAAYTNSDKDPKASDKQVFLVPAQINAYSSSTYQVRTDIAIALGAVFQTRANTMEPTN